jgi:ribosome maturation factor RimP
MIDKDYIREIVEKTIEGTAMFVTSVNVKPGNKIMVFLDGDQGVTIEECVRVSKSVESSLNRENEDFELNVSSYGLTSPLALPRQFLKNCGKVVTVLMPDGKKINGTIISATDENFELKIEKVKKKAGKDIDDELLKLSYNEVKEVKLKISF